MQSYYSTITQTSSSYTPVVPQITEGEIEKEQALQTAIDAAFKVLEDRIIPGRITITDPATSGAVAFASALASTNYSIAATAREITVGAANLSVYVTAKAVTGFTLNISGAMGGGAQVAVEYVVVVDAS